MLIRAASTADIEEISALITQLTQVYIAPTCTNVGAETLVNAMSVESVTHYFSSGYQYHVAMNEAGELGGECSARLSALWLYCPWGYS